jgi:hypothetical protein
MTSEDYKERHACARNPHTERNAASEEAGRESANAAATAAVLLWSIAALMETLALVGGMIWIMRGPGAIGMGGRVALVALAAVLGGGAFALAAARKSA